MGNFLRKYSTEAEFNNDNSITCKTKIVSHIINTKQTKYAPKYVNGDSIKAKSIKLSSSSPIKIEDCKATDILCALDDGSYIMIESGATIQGTPIGVCIIPTSHDVYGDGTCAVMSIKPMNYNTPTVGGSSENQSMRWGGYDVDISGCTELLNYNVVNQCGIGSAQTETITTSRLYLFAK